MELRHLRYFVAVAEEQNITRAAARLHVSQPPLSRQIRDLESELGIELFTRGARTIRLTEAGRVFLTEAREALRRVAQAVETAQATAQGMRGEIRVGYAPSLTTELLPKILRFFQEATPGIRVQLHDFSTSEMLHGLHEDRLHVALVVKNTPRAMEGLAFEPLQSHAVCAAIPPEHSMARARKVGLAQIARERLVAFTRADYPEYHFWVAGLFASCSQQPLIVEEHDGVTSLMAAVEAGRGIALVAQGIHCMASPRLKIRPLQPPPPPLVLGLARRKDANSPLVRNFVAAARRASAGQV